MINGLLALVLLASPAYAQQPPAISAPQELPYELPKFDCGLVTNYSGQRIGDGCLQEATNVLIGDDGSVSRRYGRSKFNAVAISTPAAIRRLYKFDASDGSQYVVAVSTDKLWRATSSGQFTAITGMAGLSGTENTDCVQGLGRFWCVNQIDGLKFWTGAATGTASGAPFGSLIDLFRNRIIISDVSGSQSSLFGSGDIDGENWTTNNQSTSPFIIRIGGVNDGEFVKCLMGTYNDTYLIGTENRLYGLYGFDNDDFTLRELSREVGCISDTSVQEMDGSLLWLSRRGLERMRGTNTDWKISRPIINLIDTILVAPGNDRSAFDSTQEDFNAGNKIAAGAGAPVDSDLLPGSLTQSTFTAVDTSSSDFAGGTLTGLSAVDVIGSVTLSSTTFFDDFADGSFASNPGWSDPSGNWVVSGNQLLNSAGTGRIFVSHTLSTGSFRFDAVSSPTAGNTIDIKFISNGSALADPGYALSVEHGTTRQALYIKRYPGPVTLATLASYAPINGNDSLNSYRVVRSSVGLFQVYSSTDALLLSATDTTYNTATHLIVNCDSGNCRADNFNFVGYSTFGVQVSRIFDIGYSTPVHGTFDVDMSSSAELQINFRVQASTSINGTFETLTSQTPGAKISAAARRFIRYESIFRSESSTKTPSIESVTLKSATTGQFIAQCRNPGTEITAWGLLTCGIVPNSGSISLYVSTGPTCHSVTRTTAVWTAQGNNAVIGVATAPFVSYRADWAFSVFIPTNQVILQSCLINWEAGSNRTEVASGVYDHKYHLFYTTSTDGSPNTTALVLDQNDRWTFWNNTPARSATSFRQSLLTGDGAATGKVFRLYTGDDDDGSEFTSRIRTKDSDLGLWKQKKTFGNLWLEFLPEQDAADDVELSISAYLDLTNKYVLSTINLDEDTGLIAASVPWPNDTQQTGRYFSLQIENTGRKPWTFYRGSLSHTPLREE